MLAALIGVFALVCAIPWLVRGLRGPALADRVLGVVLTLDLCACAAAAALTQAEAHVLAGLAAFPAAACGVVVLGVKHVRFGAVQPRLVAPPAEQRHG
ncbi:MAG: hypothetical protein K2P95_04040 [Hyphomonadaceae bacterium]|nr:hypothetical protein [Hyphomonadaceae bacterium]